MGTKETREQKIGWMKINMKVTKDKAELLRQFCRVFSSSMQTAKEIYNLTK